MSNLQITGLSVFTVRVPVRGVRRQGSGDNTSGFDAIIVRIDTDAGISGWGEACPWPVFSGTAEAAVAALHVYLRPLLIGADPFRVEWLLSEADRVLVRCTEAKAAMETALLDIIGKALKTPIHTLLGGAFRKKIPLSVSLAAPSIEEDVETAKELYKKGHRIFKVKTGFAGHPEDLRRLDLLRTGLPADVILRIDYNQGLDAFDAIAKLRDIERFRPTFIEQPVSMYQNAALAEITRAIDTPIMADESVFTPIDALSLTSARVADCFNIKIAKSGGLLRGKEVAAIAGAAGMPCYGGCMFETGISHLAGTHLVAASPNFTLGCEFYQATYYLKVDVLAEPFPVMDGHVVVPDRPGLGIEVDEDKVRRFATDVLS